MTKLANKFILGITITLMISCICAIRINTNFIEQFYLHQKKAALSSISEQFSNELREPDVLDQVIQQIEEIHKVTIVRIETNNLDDHNIINNEIRNALINRGIGFQKYWLWSQDYEHILTGNHKIRLYQQENLNYSLLIDYMQDDDTLFAITMIVPNIRDAFHIINQFLILVNLLGMIITIAVIIILTKKITKPLNEFAGFASNLKNNTFLPLHINTKDELASVADSFNAMGEQLISYQESLKNKNKEMEQLLDNVTHDLQTPISLIQLYASGAKDGLDDGTFLDTIISESTHLSAMVEQLLLTSRIKNQDTILVQMNLNEFLHKLIKEFSLLAQSYGQTIKFIEEESITLYTSQELMKSLFMNLLSNAIKYSSGSLIEITITHLEDQVRIIISNETNQGSLDLANIWTPYYVGEQSRNKCLSGTGLGLAIVKKICEQLNYTITTCKNNRKIIFTLIIPYP